MAYQTNFTANVDHRVVAAETIHKKTELRALFEKYGGLSSDLEEIVAMGNSAAALNALQGTTTGLSVAATQELAVKWANLQVEYKTVMGVVDAVLHELSKVAGQEATCVELAAILKDETPVTVTEVTKDGATKKVTRKVKSLANVRAEVESDFTRLEALTGAHEALAKRKVTRERLAAGKKAAAALKEQFGETAVKRAARKGATKTESGAVADMKRKWGSIYRILGRAALESPEIAGLLKVAATSRAIAR
jgi:hypothetical protein